MSDYVTWLAAVRGAFRGPCWLCQRLPAQAQRCEMASGGIIDGHHIIRKSRLKREFPHGAYVYEDGSVDAVPAAHRRVIAPNATEVNGVRVVPLDAILWDPRNGLVLRRWHHDELEQRRVRILRTSLPRAVEEFAAEFGLLWSLERDFGARTEAA